MTLPYRRIFTDQNKAEIVFTQQIPSIREIRFHLWSGVVEE
jgi:hypothetical protein